MSHTFTIAFDDEDLRIDEVIQAVVPIDAFTGQIVRSGVSAEIEGMPRPIRNRSGHLVFIDGPDRLNFPEDAEFTIEVDAKKAGYFDPADEEFKVPKRADRDLEHHRTIVKLIRRPTFDFAPETTLVLGVVVRGDSPAEAVIVEAVPESGLAPMVPQSAKPFTTITDEKGAFALPIRMPSDVGETSEGQFVNFSFREGDVIRLKRKVKAGRTHSFMKPIDLTVDNSDGDEIPALVAHGEA